jgi:ADP-ribose pyrophosphatase YjhB (NUDIX family)
MPRRIPFKLISTYWRVARGATLGAQGVVIDSADRVLLVRHGYRPGWHFPGGGVEWREPAETALARELEEETGVVMTGRPALHGLFGNFQTMPSDHIAVYIVRQWERPSIPPSSYEIRESRFFARSELPPDINAGAARRLAEIFDGLPSSALW